MPQVIIPALVATGTVLLIGGTAQLTAALVIGGLTLITGYVQQRRLKKLQGGLNLDLDNRRTLVRNSAQPRHVPYGYAEYSPSIFYMETKKSGQLDMGLVLAGEPITSIEQMHLSGGSMLSPAVTGYSDIQFLTGRPLSIPSGANTGNGLSDYAERMARNSDPNQDNTYTELPPLQMHATNGRLDSLVSPYRLLGDDEGNLTNGDSLAKVVLHLNNPPTNSATKKPHPSVPNVSFSVLRDNYHYPPNYGDIHPNIRVHIDRNAALACYDYALRYTSYTADDIDLDELLLSMEACENYVYEANGVITASDAPDAVFEEFAKAMGGGAVFDRAGKLVIQAAPLGRADPILTIDEDDIIGEWQETRTLPRDSLYSAVSVDFLEAPLHPNLEAPYDVETGQTSTPISEVTGLPTHVSFYYFSRPSTRREVAVKDEEIESIVGKKTLEISSQLINNEWQAKSLALTTLRRQRFGRQLNLRVNAKGVKAVVGKNVLVNMPAARIEGEKFKVVSSTLNPDLTSNLILREENDSIYPPQPFTAKFFQ